MAGKRWWEEYEEEDKRQQGSSQQSGTTSRWWEDIGNEASTNITNRVNTWLKNHDNYVRNYQNRYAGRKFNYEDTFRNDSKSWLDTVSKQADAFEAERQSILSYMDQYKGYLDEEWANSVRNALTSGSNAQQQIRKSATQDNEYWNSFGSDKELVKKYGSAEGVYQYAQRADGYKNKYTGMGVTDLQTALNALEDGEEKEWLAYNQTNILKNTLSQNADWAERSKYKSTYRGGEKYNSLAGRYTDTGFDDIDYDYINRNETARGRALVNSIADNTSLLGLDKSYLKQMTDDEIAVYNALYDPNDKTASNAYLAMLLSDLNYRQRESQEEYWAGYAKEHPVLSSGFSILTSPLRSLSAIGQTADYLSDGTVDQNAAYNKFSYIPSSIREQVSSDIAKSGKWGDVGSWTYQLGMGMGDFLMNTAVSGGSSSLSLALMGSGAMADTVISAKDRGLSDDQAMLLGAVAGGAEIITEKFSLDALFKGGMTRGAMKYILTNAFTEGTEEVGSSLINLFADILVSKDKSEWQMQINDYLAKNPNASEQEAFMRVLGDTALSLGLDFLGGSLMGGVMGSGGAGINYFTNAAPYVQENKDALKKWGDKTDALIQEGLESDKKSDSYYLANKYQQQVHGKNGKQGKALTGYQIRNLLAANQEQIAPKDMKLIQQAAEKRLTDLGQTEDVSRLAELATKYVTGQKLTKSEKYELASSDYGSRVVNEMTPKNIESGEYTTDWAEQIGTREVNAEAYNKKKIDQVRSIIEQMQSTEDPAQYKSLGERVGTEGRFGVSESGKAVIRSTGEEIDISSLKVATVGDGQLTFKVGDREVSAGDIDFADDNQSFLVSAVSSIENITPADATAIIRDVVDTAKPLGMQLNAIDEAYTRGYYGYSEADLKAGEFAKNLTDNQLMSAYELGKAARRESHDSKVDTFKKMRTAADAIAEKNAAEGKAAPGAKNLTITFNKGNGEVVSIEEAGITDAKQSGAIEVANILHKMGLGTRVEFFSSYLSETMTVKDRKTGEVKQARVFINDQGVEQIAYSGVYRKSDGTIRVDLNAYNGKGLTLNALAHELTHFIQQWSDTKYKVLVDFLMKEYDNTDMTMHERVLAEQKRLMDIRGEEVSYDEAYDEVVANAMSKMFDDGKLVEKLAQLKAQDKTLAQKLWEGFKKILAKFIGIYEKEGALFKDAADLMEMKETFDQLQNMFAEALVEASENFQAAQEIGFEMDAETDSVSPAVMYSEQTWTESDYVQQRDKAAQEIAKAIGVSEKKAKDYIDSVNSIAKMIAEDRSRLDYFSSPGRSSFVDNAEYGGSFDFSTLCKKRRLLTGTFTAIQKALPNTALTANEILDIRNRMKEKGLEVSCGLCYVEGSRANMGQFAKEFLRLYKQYYPDAWQPNMADVNTPDGIEWVRINHPECYEQYEYFWNHYGTLKPGDKNLFASQQKPKLYQLHTEYKGEILNKFKNDDKVEDKNLNGGIRLQSFSDFEIVHLIDTMQIIMDMSRVGLAGQAYTKVPDFAWALGDTGLKINLSLIAKGVDANGRLIFDDVEGMPVAEAMKLRDRYSKNVGTILVAFNDEQLMAAMADDRVDFIIPFHRSQWKKSQYEAMGLPAKTKDYTFMQNEKYIKPQYHEYRGRMVKDKATNYMPNEYWDFSKSGKENAEAYLEMCARNNKRPKFYKLLQNNGDGSYSLKADGSTDGYWKLLIDFKMYDNEGNGSPQMAVKPDFNMEEATRMLNDYSGGHSNFPVAQGVVDSFVKDYKASHKGEQYSSQETDLDSDGNHLSKAQQEFFKDSKVRDENGRLVRVFHGTERGGFTVFSNPYPNSPYFHAFWFANADTAKSYADFSQPDDTTMLYEVYLNAKNPLVIDADGYRAVSIPTDVFASDGGRKRFHHIDDIAMYAKENGYDGLIVKNVKDYGFYTEESLGVDDDRDLDAGTVYAVFEPEQVKSVDNLSPTSDPDIRYSSQETDADAEKVYSYEGLPADVFYNEDYSYIYSYDFLTAQKDMTIVDSLPTLQELQTDRKIDPAKVLAAGYKNIVEMGGTKVGDTYRIINTYTNRPLQIGKSSITHGLGAKDPNAKRTNARLAAVIGELCKNAIPICALPNTHNVRGTYGMAVLVNSRVNGKDMNMIALITVEQQNGNVQSVDFVDVAHAVSGRLVRDIEKENRSAQGTPPGTKSEWATRFSSSIKITQFLDIVNRTHQGYLSDDVISKLGEERRGPKKALYSEHDTDYSNRDLLANAFEGLSQNSDEYKMIQEYKGRIRLLNEQEAKLAKLNAEIREIRFTEGKYDAKKLKELETEAESVAESINRQDRKLLDMEVSEPFRKVIEQERKKEAQKTKAHVKEIQQNKKLRAEQTELRHKIRKAVRDLDKLLNRGNKKTNVKEDMKDFVSKALEIADYLFTDHISNDELIRKGITVRMTPREAALVKETEDIIAKLDAATDINQPGSKLTDEEFTRLDAKRKANEDKLRDLLTTQRNDRLNTPVSKLFDDLVKAYASLKNSSQDAVKAAYNEELEKSLRAFVSDDSKVKILENMRVADMTTEELNWLYRAYTMVLTNVRNANKFHVKGMTETIDQKVDRIVSDFSGRKLPDKKLAIVVRNLSNKMGWDYEKLYYALDRIGSEAFTELIMNLANSENIVMADVIEAATFRDQIVEKYSFNDWAVNKEIDKEFLDNTGKKFKLTLGQLMSLYAYSRREGAWDHIEYGGFVFGEAALTNPRPADSYKLSKAQCEAITNTLTKEQKAYVEDMQKFLSETMGEKGNEVSMQLYGIKMFGEKNYFPIHIAGQFKAQAQESQAKAAAGFGTMSNAGFTHAQNPNAKAPFVLEGFNEVWSDHVNEMSRYHGTVPALEDIRRVMNRSSYSDAYNESISVKAVMENSFGNDAVDYFDNLYREANSGAITDKLQRVPKKLLSLFRKNSVAYKLSVLVQQPTSIIRAYAMIDKKYFGLNGFGTITSGVIKAVSDKWTNAHTNAYNEMLKYAPGVTMAKDIGGFDTHTGGSIRSYLLDTNKKFVQKWKTGTALEIGKAALDLVDNNLVANLPNLADKIAWIEIWNACKRETVATHKDLVPNSEEFMQAVGERFTEVIRATQVYDSIFAKSPMMKSKNLAVQYLTSFMNEPNTVANMAESAVRDAVRGDWKSGAKKAVVLVYAALAVGLVKSLVYAMHDDDEDETYAEKYIEALVGSLVSDFNPLSYIPIARDVSSALQGYDIERPDVAIIVDAIEALKAVYNNANKDTENMTEAQLAELEEKKDEATWKVVESVAAFLGIPVKNIRKDVMGIFNTVSNKTEMDTTKLSLIHAFEAALNNSRYFFLRDEPKSKQDKLYEAMLSGDKSYLARLKSTYKDDAAYHTAVRKALRENDSRIKEAAKAHINGDPSERVRIAKQIIADGFDLDDVVMAINAEINKLTTDKDSSNTTKVKGYYKVEDFVREAANGDTASLGAIRDDIIQTAQANGKTVEEAEKDFVSDVKGEAKEAYLAGTLDNAGAEKILLEHTDMDEEEVASKVSYWAFCLEHPDVDLNETQVEKYHEFAEPADIPLDVFEQYVEGTSGLNTIYDEWGDEVKSKREQVLEVIDSLPLTWQQKDALYLAHGYAESKIWDVPW